MLRHTAETLSAKKVLLTLVMVLEMLGLDFGTGLHRIGVNLFMAYAIPYHIGPFMHSPSVSTQQAAKLSHYGERR